MFLAVLDGYDHRSLAVLALLVVSGIAMGHGWGEVWGSGGPIDLRLGLMWVWLGVVLPWRVRPAHDICLLGLGMVGGGLIETWGTWTGVWWYFTRERPPWWVVPAWATTALAGQRTAYLIVELGRRLPERLRGTMATRALRASYWCVLPAFALSMAWFSARAACWPAVTVAAATMIVVIASSRSPDLDVIAFAAGSLLGVFIESWGTQHGCWTYYTRQTPPAVAIFAHGFATLGFLRAYEFATWVFERYRKSIHSAGWVARE